MMDPLFEAVILIPIQIERSFLLERCLFETGRILIYKLKGDRTIEAHRALLKISQNALIPYRGKKSRGKI